MDGTLDNFARKHFGAVDLGDLRRNKRLVKIADQMVRHPGGTLPVKMGTPADLKALYRLVDCDEVTHQAVIHPHTEHTRALMLACSGVVLLIHDTTQLDYTGKHSLQGIGQIAKGFHRGYLCHNTLALKADSGEVMGLANQILHVREKVPKKEPRATRRRRVNRESRLWKQGSEAVGPPPQGGLWVDVCDRGGDLFEYLDHKHAQGGWYVVRSKHDRIVWADGNPDRKVKLHAHAAALPRLGTWSLSVKENTGQSAREAKVAVGCAKVTLPVPRPVCGDHGDQPLETYVVHVMEIDPPADVQPLQWILLTNVPVKTFEQSRERSQWYARRPVVEEYHKGQKTGCGIELPQFTSEKRLEPVIAMLSVVAVFLLTLRDTARNPELAQKPATDLVPKPWVQMLNAWRWNKRDRPTTIKEFLLAVARLGGHLNRKSDGNPGWLTIWRGWQDLMIMCRGIDAMERSG
jgi:hypothetical protein